jgi:hypothetical protein
MAKLLSQRPSRPLTDYERPRRILERPTLLAFYANLPRIPGFVSAIVCPFRPPWQRSFERDGGRGPWQRTGFHTGLPPGRSSCAAPSPAMSRDRPDRGTLFGVGNSPRSCAMGCSVASSWNRWRSPRRCTTAAPGSAAGFRCYSLNPSRHDLDDAPELCKPSHAGAYGSDFDQKDAGDVRRPIVMW